MNHNQVAFAFASCDRELKSFSKYCGKIAENLTKNDSSLDEGLTRLLCMLPNIQPPTLSLLPKVTVGERMYLTLSQQNLEAHRLVHLLEDDKQKHVEHRIVHEWFKRNEALVQE